MTDPLIEKLAEIVGEGGYIDVPGYPESWTTYERDGWIAATERFVAAIRSLPEAERRALLGGDQ